MVEVNTIYIYIYSVGRVRYHDNNILYYVGDVQGESGNRISTAQVIVGPASWADDVQQFHQITQYEENHVNVCGPPE